jgi:hypothetical protein
MCVHLIKTLNTQLIIFKIAQKYNCTYIHFISMMPTVSKNLRVLLLEMFLKWFSVMKIGDHRGFLRVS